MENEQDIGGISAFRHSTEHLPAVTVDIYNAELRDAEGFIGDRASRRAFVAVLDEWRERLRRAGADPLGDTPTSELKKKMLDKVLSKGDSVAAGLIHSAVEEFAQQLASAIRRLLHLRAWRDTQSIIIGGGLRASRVGELAIGRAAVLLKADGHDVELRPIRHHPDEAGLIGAVQLAPSWVFTGHDALLAVDIGGTKIRAGAVQLNLKKAPDLSAARVMEYQAWRHANDQPTRDQAVEHLADMLGQVIRQCAKDGVKLAPFVGIGCPGLILHDGSIERGGQNLPGNWDGNEFNLPQRMLQLIPEICGHHTTIIMHNDAVVQGLSEVPFMAHVARWGVLTVGTGLGNACFSSRRVTRADTDG